MHGLTNYTPTDDEIREALITSLVWRGIPGMGTMGRVEAEGMFDRWISDYEWKLLKEFKDLVGTPKQELSADQITKQTTKNIIYLARKQEFFIEVLRTQVKDLYAVLEKEREGKTK